MLSSSVRHFTDPDQYALAIRAVEAEITVAERGDFTAVLTRIDLHRLWMQHLDERRPRLAHAALTKGRAIFSILGQTDPDLIVSGKAVPPHSIVCHGIGEDYYQRLSGPTCQYAMSLPVADMAAAAASIAGYDLALSGRETRVIVPHPQALAKLRRLHVAAARLAEGTPELIANPEAARGLEQTLISALFGCLETGDATEESTARRRHDAIMRRFYRALEEDPDRALYLPELCAAIGVPERTLHACCQEHLGMGPKRYLLLRRLHLARRALSRVEPGTTSVTEIATQFGFWHLGRFAGAYRELFGEPPSVTLHHPPA